MFYTTVFYRWLNEPVGREVRTKALHLQDSSLSLLQTARNNSGLLWRCMFIVALGASFAMKLYEKIAESLKLLSKFTGDEWRG